MIVVGTKRGKTSRKLAQTLGCEHIFCKGDCSNCAAMEKETIINYGGHCEDADFNSNIVHNKLEAYKIMRDAGVPQPQMWETPYEIDSFPVLGRNIHHSRGSDIVVLESDFESECADSDFFTKLIDKRSEYRAHVLGDRVFSVTQKQRDEEADDIDPIIRSRGRGWKQVPYDGQYRQEVKKLALKAVSALGYDFGAVDIIRDENNNLLVLEVNSAPALSDYKLEKYAEYFRGEI